MQPVGELAGQAAQPDEHLCTLRFSQVAEISIEAFDHPIEHFFGHRKARRCELDQRPAAILGIGNAGDKALGQEPLQGFGGAAGRLYESTGQLAG